MELKDLGFRTKQLEKLASNNITTVQELLYKSPRKYNDFSEAYDIAFSDKVLSASELKTPIVLKGEMVEITIDRVSGKKMTAIKIKVANPDTRQKLYVNIFGSYHEYEQYERMYKRIVYVGGIVKKVDFDNNSILCMSNPSLFTTETSDLKIYPIYKKYKGISSDYYLGALDTSISDTDNDYLPESLRGRYGLPTYKQTVNILHRPFCMEQITKAEQRIVFDDMLYFTSKLANIDNSQKNTITSLPNQDVLTDFINTRPYTLTDDQQNAISLLKDKMSINQTSALIQGDVSCGKTIVAMSLMMLMAENGYQSVLIAPTGILAKQHFDELSQYGNKYGFETVLLTGDLKPKERTQALKAIKDNDALFIVGTHSCFSKDVEYNHLGLVITDEEHKFGVLQREAIKKKVDTGIHTITMSATPIPRTLACSIYGNNTEVITIKQMPGGRKPVKTAVCSSDGAIFSFLEVELAKNNQVYVVCPLIDEAAEDSTMAGISSIEAIAKAYKEYFKPLGYRVGVLTGQNNATETADIKEMFANNEIQILIATTVIEVGVNVPNATVMVIRSAERFGLATLHQLRGRVGRGIKQSYCILQKTNDSIDSTNLEVLEREIDGFEIAKADLKHRGSGNILGIEQSGNNKFIDYIIKYPEMYEKVTQIAKALTKEERQRYIETYEEYYPSCL